MLTNCSLTCRIAALLIFWMLPSCAGVAISIPKTVSSPEPVQTRSEQDPQSFDKRWTQIDEKEEKREQEAEAKKAAVEESEVLEERRRGYQEDKPIAKRKGVHLYWDFGPRFDAFDGELSIIVGGRLHVDVAEFSNDPDIEAAFGAPDPGLNLRRAFIETGGVYHKLEFNFWVNFSELDETRIAGGTNDLGSTMDFRNVFVGIRDLPLISGIRAGYFKEPFGLEETTSSNDITFMERSLTTAFVMSRNLGIMLNKRLTGERRITTALGLYREANNDLETADGYGLTGRITSAPWSTKEGRRLIHLGVAATYRQPSKDLLRFSSRPESTQAQYMVDTGFFRADRDVRIGMEAAVVFESFSFQTETIVTAVRGQGSVGNPVFLSYYLMTSLVLTGEHRSYRKRVGAFGSVHPKNPIFTKGSWGAWELTGRYSFLDLDSGSIQGGVLHDSTVGLNGYLNDNLRLMFNYILAHPEGVGNEHILQLRTQLSF